MFVLSKLFWALIQPSNLVVLALLLAMLFVWRGYRRLGIGLVGGVTVVLVMITVLPIGVWLLSPLENRFSPPDLPDRIDGVVMLGGAVDGNVSAIRGQIALNDAAERVTALLALARRYPDARLVVSGGMGKLVADAGSEARALAAFFPGQGLDRARILFEDRSRNTYENAVLSMRQVQPGPDERWLLVTSAFHMRRAIGVFRRAGWPLIAYPVDYRSGRTLDLATVLEPLAQPDMSERLFELDLAVKAWVGLVAYRLLGRTDALFPAP